MLGGEFSQVGRVVDPAASHRVPVVKVRADRAVGDGILSTGRPRPPGRRAYPHRGGRPDRGVLAGSCEHGPGTAGPHAAGTGSPWCPLPSSPQHRRERHQPAPPPSTNRAPPTGPKASTRRGRRDRRTGGSRLGGYTADRDAVRGPVPVGGGSVSVLQAPLVMAAPGDQAQDPQDQQRSHEGPEPGGQREERSSCCR